MQMMKTVVGAALLAMVLGAGTATFAQAPSDKPAATKMSPDEKKAISKSCSDQANAKGLRGRERHKFRSHCKRHGGKEAT
jgi:psiF repeat